MIDRFVRWIRGDTAPPSFDYRKIPDSPEEWRTGDIAVAVTDSWHIIETGAPPTCPCPNLGDMLRVIGVSVALGPQMLRLEGYGDSNFVARCFKKRRPDAAEACDKDFLTLLRKQAVSASGTLLRENNADCSRAKPSGPAPIGETPR